MEKNNGIKDEGKIMKIDSIQGIMNYVLFLTLLGILTAIIVFIYELCRKVRIIESQIYDIKIDIYEMYCKIISINNRFSNKNLLEHFLSLERDKTFFEKLIGK